MNKMGEGQVVARKEENGAIGKRARGRETGVGKEVADSALRG